MRHRTAGACETNIVISVMVFIVGFWVYGSSVAAVRQQRASTAAFASRSGIANATHTRTHTHTHSRELRQRVALLFLPGSALCTDAAHHHHTPRFTGARARAGSSAFNYRVFTL